MDKKKLVPIAAVLVLAVVGAAAFIIFGMGPKDEEEVKKAFNDFSFSVALGNKNAIAGLISRTFNDAGMVYATALEELGTKRPGYAAEINQLNIRQNQAEISYIRKELIDKKPVTTMIGNEIWIKEDDGKWRLFKLSGIDKARIAKAVKEKKVREEAMLLEEERNAGLQAVDEKLKQVFYTPRGKRDPFESLIVEILEEEASVASLIDKKCDIGRPREFLEGFDLFSIKLVGILKAEKYIALVETQNGNGYTIKGGMHLGRNCGKIIEINPNAVIVEEKIMRPRGDFLVRKTELKLKQNEG